jgi:parvulin-like peptidyl-prolyl isomerase
VLSEGTGGNEKVAEERRSELLKRLINTRLIIQEARRMGLDEIPELKNRVDVFSRVTLREELMERHVEGIKPDEKEVETVYKNSVKEWKIKSILFEKEEDAKEMEKAIKEGKNFDKTFKKFLADKKGRDEAEGQYLKGKDLLPEISQAVSKMEVGSISPILRIKAGFVILKVEGVRFPENPAAKAQARQAVLRKMETASLVKYDRALKKRYAKVNEEVLKGLDFESKEPGFEKLLKDKRVVAEIKEEEPITVGEMTEYLRQQLYHGVERAVESKRLNTRRDQILEEMLHKRVFLKEALRLGINKTEGYKNKVKEYENSLLFGTFIQKAVVPDVKLKEEELKAYYDQHIKDYTYPEMMKMSTLLFGRREDAEKTILTLRQGTEFQWVKANVEGQLDSATQGVLDLDGKLLITRDLPEDLRKAISGAKAGDFRLYPSSENYFYVLYIQQVVPSRPQPYEEARERVARKIYDDKLKRAVEDYADKLRAVSDVKVYLQD